MMKDDRDSLRYDVDRFIDRRARPTLRTAIEESLEEIAASAEDEFLGRLVTFPWRWHPKEEPIMQEAAILAVEVEVYGEDEPHLVFVFEVRNPRSGHIDTVRIDPAFCSWTALPSGLGEQRD